MKIISAIAQKGGTGKTTISLNLAVVLSSTKNTVLLDIDPQASAAKWGDRRVSAEPSIRAIQASRLDTTLEELRSASTDWVIIDTAPHSERDALIAARMADLVLVPCRPGILDLDAMRITADLLELSKQKGIAVLNGCPATGSLAHEASTVLEGMGFEVCPIKLGYRAAFTHSLTAGLGVGEYEPQGKAAHEIRRLRKWLEKRLR